MDRFTLREYLTKFLIAALLVLFALVAGTSGYMLIEGWNLLDALFMTIITMSTIGYGETHPLSPAGRLFTIGLILGGVLILGYAAALLTQILIATQFRNIIGRRAMQKRIESLRDHFIICGFGRMGRTIAQEFSAAKVPFVVIEADEARHAEVMKNEIPAILGSAEEDENLLSAGIARARGLIATADKDDVNVFVTLSARHLNPNLMIIARSGDEPTDVKLKRAGANRVWSPYRSAGRQIARSVLNPNVLDFIEGVQGRSGIDIELAEISVAPGSLLVGKTLFELNVMRTWKAIIVTIHRDGGRGEAFLIPPGDTAILAGDLLQVASTAEGVKTLSKVAAAEGA